MSVDTKVRVSFFADHPGDDAADFELIRSWLDRWRDHVTVANYSTGGWEHVWHVEAPRRAIAEIPKRFFCCSEWANYPQPFGGAEDESWSDHFDDGKE